MFLPPAVAGRGRGEAFRGAPGAADLVLRDLRRSLQVFPRVRSSEHAGRLRPGRGEGRSRGLGRGVPGEPWLGNWTRNFACATAWGISPRREHTSRSGEIGGPSRTRVRSFPPLAPCGQLLGVRGALSVDARDLIGIRSVHDASAGLGRAGGAGKRPNGYRLSRLAGTRPSPSLRRPRGAARWNIRRHFRQGSARARSLVDSPPSGARRGS